MLSQVPTADACLSCGACCAYFRVSFYWAEGMNMPEHYTEPVTAVYSCMCGTNQSQPRCVALEGEVGQQVSCGIYELRSSSCKEVQNAALVGLYRSKNRSIKIVGAFLAALKLIFYERPYERQLVRSFGGTAR